MLKKTAATTKKKTPKKRVGRNTVQKTKFKICGSKETSTGKPCKIKFKIGSVCRIHLTKKKPIRKTRKKKKPVAKKDELPGNLKNQSELAKFFDLDRATVRTRLEQANVHPKNDNKRNYLYDFEEARIAIERAKTAEFKSLKIEHEARLKGIELKIKQGKYAPVADFTDLTYELIERLCKRFKRMPGQVVRKISRCNSPQEARKLLEDEVDRIFEEVRNSPLEYLVDE